MRIVTALALGVLLSAPLAAQSPAPAQPAPATATADAPNADTRQALRQVLQLYPYTVGEILYFVLSDD